MMNEDIELIKFVKDNASFFKKYQVSIFILGKNYNFDIASITDDHIKLQYRFKYSSIFYSNDSSLENTIKNIIDDDKYGLSKEYALAQRAVTRRNLRGTSFSIFIDGVNESFKINSVSRENISIEKVIEFDEIEKSTEGISSIVKHELYSFKPEIEEKVRLDEENRINKQKERELKNRVYSKTDLISICLSKKYDLKMNSFPLVVEGKKYSVNIDGIGDFAVKLVLPFTYAEIFYAESNSIGEKIKNFIDDSLEDFYFSINDFSNQIEKNKTKINFETIDLLIGDNYSQFKIFVDSFEIRLVKFVHYTEIMKKFNSGENCLETILKKHVENFKPKPFDWGYSYEFEVPKKSNEEYKHPTVSNKEDPEVVRRKIKEKKEAHKKQDQNKSFYPNHRSDDMNKILR